MSACKMQSKCNSREKKAILDLKKDGSFILPKAIYTPFIGDNYENDKKKLLIISDEKDFNGRKRKKTYIGGDNATKVKIANSKKRYYPAKNYCSLLIDSINDYLSSIVEKEGKTINQIAFYNFYFNRFDDGIQIPKSKKTSFLIPYYEALAEIISVLKPQKIIFYGDQLWGDLTTRTKYPEAFGFKTLVQFLGNIKYEHITKNRGRNSQIATIDSAKKELKQWWIELFSIEKGLFDDFFSNEAPETREILKKNNKLNTKDIEKIEDTELFPKHPDSKKKKATLIALKKIALLGTRIYNFLTKEDRKLICFRYVLDFLEDSDKTETEKWQNGGYISYLVLDTLLEFMEARMAISDSMSRVIGNELDVFIDEFNKERERGVPLKSSGGIENKLYKYYRTFKNNTDESERRYADIMCNRIFIEKSRKRIDKILSREEFESRLKCGDIDRKWGTTRELRANILKK